MRAWAIRTYYQAPMKRRCGQHRLAGFDRGLWVDRQREATMNQIIYIVGLVVIVIAVLSFFGLR
jgi:hypothetical protein